MFTIKHQIEGLIALHSAEYERRRAEFPALVRALEAGSAKSIEVEGTLADVRIPVEEHQGNPGKAGGAVVLVIDCAAYVQLLGVDAHSDAGMQLIRLLAQAKPGRFVDLNFWSSRTPDLEMPGWMRPSPVVSLREGLPDGHLLLGADETQLWRNLLPKAATLNTEDLETAGAARLRHDWHRDLLTATCQRFQEFARRVDARMKVPSFRR